MRQLTGNDEYDYARPVQVSCVLDARMGLRQSGWSKIAGDLSEGVWRESWTNGSGKIAMLRCNSLEEDGSDTGSITDFKLTGATCYLMAGSLIVLGD